ncbi:MAG: hypothetical protein EOM56_12890 [Deltaproteobacteria bacterium]|nr:hypothetical protein [Deltaproteobacteria bacterium]
MAAKKKPQFDAYGLWQSIIKENQDLARAVSSNNRVDSERAMLGISALYVAKAREALGEDASLPLPEGIPFDMKKTIVACIEGTVDVPTGAGMAVTPERISPAELNTEWKRCMAALSTSDQEMVLVGDPATREKICKMFVKHMVEDLGVAPSRIALPSDAPGFLCDCMANILNTWGSVTPTEDTKGEPSPEELDKMCLWKNRTDGSPAVITPELDTATETAVAQLRDEAVTVSNVEMDATILLAETRGVSQQAQFIETVSRMTMLTRLAHIKESKGYKGAKVRDANGELQSIKTWPEFCSALGMSRSLVDEDLNNLSVFGDNLLKMQDALGIGYRELRKLRAGFSNLDDASRALALEEVKNAGDKEELLAALDEMGVRNAKLTQANKEKDDQRASLDKLLGESRRKEYELQRKLDAMERPVSPDEEARALIYREANMKREIDEGCRDLVRAADALAVIASNTFNCGNGESWRSLPEERQAQMVDYVNERISSACGRMRDSLLNTGVDVDLALVFDPEAGMDASDGADSADTLQEQAEA